MGRKPNPERRAELLERIADHIVAHGLVDLSLRPLAKAIGTSGRMLVYYFGSKENLLVEAIGVIRERMQADFLREISEGGGSDDILKRTFEQSTAPKWERYSRFFYAVFGIALQEPDRFPGFLASTQTSIRLMIQTQLQANDYPEKEAEELATFYSATLRGLAIDLLATGDRDRVNRALNVLSGEITRAGEKYRPNAREGGRAEDKPRRKPKAHANKPKSKRRR